MICFVREETMGGDTTLQHKKNKNTFKASIKMYQFLIALFFVIEKILIQQSHEKCLNTLEVNSGISQQYNLMFAEIK